MDNRREELAIGWSAEAGSAAGVDQVTVAWKYFRNGTQHSMLQPASLRVADSQSANKIPTEGFVQVRQDELSYKHLPLTP